MGEDQELRARIEAQVASRRAAAAPAKRDWLGRRIHDDEPDDEPDDAPEAPQTLEPVRPWLLGEMTSGEPDDQTDAIEEPSPAANSRPPGPPRPWLTRKPASAQPPSDRDLAAEAPSVVDPQQQQQQQQQQQPLTTDSTGGTVLQPVRPWLRRQVRPETDRPEQGPGSGARRGKPEPRRFAGQSELPGSQPTVPADNDTPAPPPSRVLQVHWAHEREVLIAERAALRAEREELLAQRATLSDLRRPSPTDTGAAPDEKQEPKPGPDEDGAVPAAGKRHRVTLGGVSRLLVVVVIAAVIATLLRTYVVAPYYIPSASMEPTLHGCTGCNNDHVLVDKLSYKRHDVRRGDVVVFNRPKTWQVSEKVLIKRVIGLPGDTLTAKNGIVYVDGLALNEPYVNKACQSGTTNFTATPVTVLDGQAFVMGDNRCDSSDSRRFGAIPQSAVIGRAFLIILPLGRLHWL